MVISFKGSFEKHQTLKERISDLLRDAIIHGELKPSERVSEPELAEKFGISRTPIREALRHLAAEGFLEITSRKGARVASITPKDVSEFYELKLVLEGYAARLAATRLTERDIEKMDFLNKQMERAAKAKDWKHAFKFHNEFHNMFLSRCGNDQLYQLIVGLVKKFQRFRILLAREGKTEGSVTGHCAMLEAFRKRDQSLAERLAAENAVFGKETIIKEILHNDG